jgi:plastocyanin
MNTTDTAHTVTSDTLLFQTPAPLLTQQTFSYTFLTAGTYSYYCNYHPDMHGKIVVTE